MVESSHELADSDEVGCSSCVGLGNQCNADPKGREPRTDADRPPHWWTERRWQLLTACYSLLVVGLSLEHLFRLSLPSTAAYAGSVAAGAFVPARNAWNALRRLQLTIGTLVVVGALGAIALGLWEEAASLVAVYSLGAVFEARVIDRARHAMQLVRDLAPRVAVSIHDGLESDVPVEQVNVGDLIRIRPGMRIPLDGTVVEGHSVVDESAISGEPLPVDKGPGDDVISGTLNSNGGLTVRVAARAEDSTIAEVIRAVEEARKNKSSFETFGERFGAVYTPVMFGVALIVAVVPALLGLYWATWFYRSLVVLVISCSCGLILSVPVATLSAITAGARRGLVIKGGSNLEAASRIDTVVFDKTGTLTRGQPEVVAVRGFRGHLSGEVLALAARVELRSEHPLARAVVTAALTKESRIASSENFEALPGRGARATVDSRRVCVGGTRWANELGIDLTEMRSAVEMEGVGTLMVIWDQDGLIGGMRVADTVRPEAQTVVEALRASGIRRIIMMTGDTQHSAETIAREVGGIEVFANLLPLEKAAQVRSLQLDGHRVAVVGDGINDAPALAQSDLGIAMGLRGTDIAQATCDVILVDDDLRRLTEVFSLGRSSVRVMKQNVALSVAEIGILVPLALLGVVGLVAGIALNEGSALAVSANGLRLARSHTRAGVPLPSRAPSAIVAPD